MCEDDVRRIFADAFKLPVANVRPEMSPETVIAWDSFGHMELITAIEAELGIELTMDEIIKIDSFGALCQVLEASRAGE